MGLPDAAGAWRRDGSVVLPDCLDGPALEAARRDLATVYPSAGEYHTAPGAGRSRVYAGGEPGAIIALPFPRPRCAALPVTARSPPAPRAPPANAPDEISSVWRSAAGRSCRPLA